MTSSAAWQLAFGIVAVLVIFVLATNARRTVAIGAMLLWIPFQIVTTRYGSSSVVIAYGLGAVLLLEGSLKVRLLPGLALIVLAYFASLAMGNRDQLTSNAIELFLFFSCLIVFLLAYNYARLVQNERSTVDLLLVINALVVGYCLLQLTVGPGERFTPLGISSLAFNPNRNPGDPRLIGPFDNPGSTAGYFTLMILVCAVDLMRATGRRRFLVQFLAGLNLIGLVATGNRTGFLILIAMFPALLFLFRKELGAWKIMMYSVGGALFLTLAGTIAVLYTDFDQMFQRMGTVAEIDEGIPKTRQQAWPIAIEKIKERPWFGEGPHFLTAEQAETTGASQYKFEELGELSTTFDPYPHSLYLYLLRTVGIVGLVAVVGFFVGTWWVLYSAARRRRDSGYGSAIVRLGLLLIPAFLVAQITLEFNRPATMDYAQFIFALMGLLVGTSDREFLEQMTPNGVAMAEPIQEVGLHGAGTPVHQLSRR